MNKKRRWAGSIPGIESVSPLTAEGFELAYTEAMNSDVVRDGFGTLAKIAKMPCLTDLLGDGLRDDYCGCASCMAKEVLAPYEKDLKEKHHA